MEDFEPIKLGSRGRSIRVDVDQTIVEGFWNNILIKLNSTKDSREGKQVIFAALWIIFNHYYRTLSPLKTSEYCAIKTFYGTYRDQLNNVFRNMKNYNKLRNCEIKEEPLKLNPDDIPLHRYVTEVLMRGPKMRKDLLGDSKPKNFNLLHKKLTDFDVEYYLILMCFVRNTIIHGSLVLKNLEFAELFNFSVETFSVFMKQLIELTDNGELELKHLTQSQNLSL